MRALTTIGQLHQYVGQSVWIGCWLNGKRSSGKIQFLQLRDGTGYIQGVVVKSEVAEASWEAAKSLTQESSLYVKGTIREEPRSASGYELTVEEIDIIQVTAGLPDYAQGAWG